MSWFGQFSWIVHLNACPIKRKTGPPITFLRRLAGRLGEGSGSWLGGVGLTSLRASRRVRCERFADGGMVAVNREVGDGEGAKRRVQVLSRHLAGCN